MSNSMSMDMATATSSSAMPMATDHDMGGMGGMGDGCKISVSTILTSHGKDANTMEKMLWNWNTIDSCKRLSEHASRSLQLTVIQASFQAVGTSGAAACLLDLASASCCW